MSQSRRIKLKRRKTGGTGPPSTLLNGELAFNEVDGVLYYGKGENNTTGEAVNIIPIAGEFTSLLKDAEVSTLEEATPSNDFIVVTINGQQRAIRLFDF